MTLTRRKSKAAAAAAAAQQDDTPSTSTLTAFTISLPSDIDLDALSGLIPGEPLEAPTEDTILHLYRTLLAHVTQLDATTHEVEGLRAEAEKKEVELDQGYQDRENDKKEMENLAENLRRELGTVKSERDELGMHSGGLCVYPPPLMLYMGSGREKRPPNPILICFKFPQRVVGRIGQPQDPRPGCREGEA